jgi:3-phenylpropionate/trans-cinnamate dioxygenase ferredoxin subunit
MNYHMLPEDQLEYLAVCALSDLPSGERLFIEVDEQMIIVFNIAGGLFAIADVCSHDGGSLDEAEVEGYEVLCPRHGARFDLRSGEATRLPAVAPIPAYPVRVVDGMVEVGLPTTG